MNQAPFMTKPVGKIVMATIVTVIALAKVNPAFALDELYSPNVDYRELSLEYSGSRSFDTQSDKNNAQEHGLVIEAGITPRWMVETSAGFAKDPNANAKLSDLEVENRFQLLEAGEYWLDAGILVAYDFSTQSQQPDSVEVKLLLQKDVGRITTMANIGFFEDVGNYSAPGGADYVVLWNTRYRYNEYFQPGIEMQSDLGQSSMLGHFNGQEHYVGPAVYGRLFGHLRYQAGYFKGISDAASQSAVRMLVEYETHF